MTVRRTIRRALTVPAASAAGLAAWAVAGPLAGINLDVRQGGGIARVEPASVVAASLLAGLAAWALLAVTERLLSGPRAAWLGSALVAIGVSLIGPLAAAVDPTGKAALVGMHLIVGAVLVYGMLGGPANRSRTPARPFRHTFRGRVQGGAPTPTSG